MSDTFETLISMLKSREEGVRQRISEAAQNGDEEDRIHHIGWLSGIEGSRRLAEYLREKVKA